MGSITSDLITKKLYVFSRLLLWVFGVVCLRFVSNRSGGVMVNVLASSVVDRGFEPRSGQTKGYKIDICCFSAKHAAFKQKEQRMVYSNQDNVSEWGDMSIRGLLFQ